jgi:hypothetical protein
MASNRTWRGGIRSRQAGHLGPDHAVCRRRSALVRKPFEAGLPALLGDHQPNSRARHGPQPSKTSEMRPPGSQSDCRGYCRPDPLIPTRSRRTEASAISAHRRHSHRNAARGQAGSNSVL